MRREYFFETDIGGMIGTEEDGMLVQLAFADNKSEMKGLKKGSLIYLLKEQINQYILGQRREFDIPLNIQGTEFQKKVYAAALQIPYGETVSYKEIALQSGSPKASRAAGGALHNNPLVLLIPCHRVIGSDRKLVGYAGGLNIKEYLLDLEQGKRQARAAVSS